MTFSSIRKYIISVCFLLIAGSAPAEPLRLLVPSFLGPEILSQHVRTTVYLELIKAFRHVDIPLKGGWILYGVDDLLEPSHNAAINAAIWPSVQADLAIWGQVYPYGNGVVVQMFLSVTPILKERKVRPEVWTIDTRKDNGEDYKIQLDIPGQFYEFEPFILPREVIIQYQKPEGLPLYRSREGDEIIAPLGKVMHFREIHGDAFLVESDGIEGWIKPTNILNRVSEAIPFAKGFVHFLRGDWRGSLKDFSGFLENKKITQNLRVHALIYSGLAKEKIGWSGNEEFETAYSMNRLDRVAASFVLMSHIANITRARDRGDDLSLKAAKTRLGANLKSVRVLFRKNGQWIRHVESYLK